MTTTIELLDTALLIAAIDDLNIEESDTREGRIEANRAYRATVANLEIQWQEWLRKSYLPGAPAEVHKAIFDHAWEQGHGGGYSSVEGLYIDLADIAHTVHLNWL